MSELNPYQILGVTENASFEEIQAAKQSLNEQYRDDSQVLESIETAYDAIIMERLRMRQEGKIKVPERIRFPEREKSSEPALSLKSLPVKTPPSWLQGWIDSPSPRDILLPAGVFGILALITIFTTSGQQSVAPLILSLGIFANVYFFNRKENRFWRGVLISFIALFMGILLGAGLAVSLGTQNPVIQQQLYTLFALGLFWLSSSFLR